MHYLLYYQNKGENGYIHVLYGVRCIPLLICIDQLFVTRWKKANVVKAVSE